jgi:SAM-dependent methyltransferase
MPEADAAGRSGVAPSPWVVRFAGLIAPGGTVLDVACGRGRHARWLEDRGHRVTGIDRDAAALSVCGASETIACDLETEPVTWPLAARLFDAVVVTNYLHRPLFAHLIAALAPGGVLLYETFATGHERYGRPSNPAFLLETGELLERCRGLIVVAYEDGLVSAPMPASVQRICCTKPLGDGSVASRHAL